MNRREFIASVMGATLIGTAGARSYQTAEVLIVGGGFAGATAANYLRQWGGEKVNVTLVEKESRFISCPFSNRVIGGQADIADISFSYQLLEKKLGVRVIHETATFIDIAKKQVHLKNQDVLPYTHLILAPGIDFLWDEIPAAKALKDKIPHAWKAGAETLLLRRQIETMPDNGVFVMSIPPAPYRCPPGPYERACLVAAFFKKKKPKAKIIILDANAEITSKKALFQQAFSTLYPQIIEYRSDQEVRDVAIEGEKPVAVLEFDKQKADVLNVILPQSAGKIALDAGLKLVNRRWVEIDWFSMAAVDHPEIQVIGDAIFTASALPKSASLANQQGKLAASRLLYRLSGETPDALPHIINACYSFVSEKEAMHVVNIYRYDTATRLFQSVPGSGGLSRVYNPEEGLIAQSLIKNLWYDSGFSPNVSIENADLSFGNMEKRRAP